MNKIFDQFKQARYELISRARSVSHYFKNGGGIAANDVQEKLAFAWTSEEQKKRSEEFHKIAAKLANPHQSDEAA